MFEDMESQTGLCQGNFMALVCYELYQQPQEHQQEDKQKKIN